jgi:hypothetical protein
MKLFQRPQMNPRPNLELASNPANHGLRGDFGGAPVAFSASLSDLTPETTYNLNTQTLQPGFRTPYWIDEIRIAASGVTLIDALGNFSGIAGFIEAKFQTGHYAFSRNPVPMGLHAPRWSRLDAGQAINGAGYNVNGSNRRSYATMRWPLPKPLFMPAGDAVQCLIRYTPYLPLTSFNEGAGFTLNRLNVTYVGRLAAPGTPPPDKRHIPWLSWFQKPTTAGYAQTNDEFRNPFSDKPLYVQRFTSRAYAAVQAGGASAFVEGPSIPGDTVRLHDSLGYAIVPDYAPLNDVFDGTRAAWTFGRTLGPREQFDLQLQNLSPTSGTASVGYSQVGIVGFREEDV